MSAISPEVAPGDRGSYVSGTGRRGVVRRTRKRPKELVGNHPGQRSAATIARSPRSLPGAAGCSLAATADRLPGRPVDHSPVRFRLFSPAPSGETKCSRRRPSATTGLSTKLRYGGELLSPKLWTPWIACGENRAPHPDRKSDKGGVCFVGSLVPPDRRRPGRLVADLSATSTIAGCRRCSARWGRSRTCSTGAGSAIPSTPR